MKNLLKVLAVILAGVVSVHAEDASIELNDVKNAELELEQLLKDLETVTPADEQADAKKEEQNVETSSEAKIFENNVDEEDKEEDKNVTNVAAE